jgi:nucleotide-binding universal stress UspA family protein
MRLLIGYDGSECAAVALADLHRAGLPAKVEAVVMSVADVWAGPIGSPAEPVRSEWLAKAIERAHVERMRAIEDARAEADSAARRLRLEFPEWSVQAEGVGDSPAWAIIKRADAWKPDLIVLGSVGRTALGRLVLGSVSQKVMTTARCSVRIARKRGGDDHAGLRLVVGVDGSAQAERAVSAVRDRTWPKGTAVKLVTALDAVLSTVLLSRDEGLTRWVAAGDEAGAWVHRMVSRAAGDLAEAGLAAEPVVARGDPKQVLVKEAEEWAADCIFVGAQGLNMAERALLGSVSAAVASRAPCSVEVVRAEPAIR